MTLNPSPQITRSSPETEAISGSEPRASWPEQLQRAFTKLERQKRDMLADVSTWTEEQRRFRADTTSWSALDVLDHLVKVEVESLLFIRSSLPTGKSIKFEEKLKARMVFLVMQSPMRIKVPAGVQSVLPSESVKEEEVIQRWQAVRMDIRDVLKRIGPGEMKFGLFHHPVSGSMTILDAMTFLSVHMTHHGYQLRRLQKTFSRLKG